MKTNRLIEPQTDGASICSNMALTGQTNIPTDGHRPTETLMGYTKWVAIEICSGLTLKLDCDAQNQVKTGQASLKTSNMRKNSALKCDCRYTTVCLCVCLVWPLV